MKVRDYFKNVTPGVDLVGIDTTVEDIIEIISKNPASRAVYVIDEEEKLVGIISVREILNILGAKYLKKRSIMVAHGILAKTAADIGYECVELMCWPVGKAERRYAGVTHIDVVGLKTTETGRFLTPFYTWGIYLDDYSSGTTVTFSGWSRGISGTLDLGS